MSLQIHINVVDGKVVLTFGEPYSWLSFTADEARDLGSKLVEMAEQMKVPPPAGKLQ